MGTLSASQCRQELERVIRASFTVRSVRVVVLETRDREEAIAVVRDAATAQSASLRHITPTGVRVFDAKRLEWSADPARAAAGDLTPVDMLDAALGAREPAVMMLEELLSRIQDAIPESGARLRLLDALMNTQRGAGAVLVLLETQKAAECIPGMLAPQVTRLSIGYPKREELADVVRVATAQFSRLAGAPIPAADIARRAPDLAEGLLGLTRKAARDVLQDALALKPADLEAARVLLVAEKSRRLSKDLSMDVLDTQNAEVPYGIDSLLQFIEEQKPRMRRYGKDRARGVLLVGPPGTGKTMLARAIGKLVDLPVVNFRVHSVMTHLLGGTERLFAEAFATLEALAPCIVFIDEIDKAFGSSGAENDGGTMSRVTGSLLSWLADNENPNFVVGTSNNLRRLAESSAMTRAERFDATFHVDVPAAAARQQIIAGALCRIAFREDVEAASKETAALSECFSGADLFAAVKRAASLAEFAGRPVGMADLKAQIERRFPRAQAQYQEFQSLRNWAAVNCEAAN